MALKKPADTPLQFMSDNCLLDNCLLLALHQRRLGRAACLPPELFEPLYYAFVDPDDSVVLLCEANALHKLDHWHRTFGVDLPAATHIPTRTRVLHYACAFNHLDTAKWIHRVLQPTAADARRSYAWSCCFDAPLPEACGSGLLEVAQWLVDTYNLTADDAGVHDGVAMCNACWNGDMAMAQWLHRTFALTTMDRFTDCMSIACQRGYLHMAQWLHQTFPGSSIQVDECIKMACRSDQLATAQWLQRTYDPEAVRVYNPDCIFYTACERGALALAKWSLATYGLRTPAFALGLALRYACRYKHAHVVAWLTTLS